MLRRIDRLAEDRGPGRLDRGKDLLMLDFCVEFGGSFLSQKQLRFMTTELISVWGTWVLPARAAPLRSAGKRFFLISPISSVINLKIT